MINENLLYNIALTQVSGISHKLVKQLLARYPSATDIFNERSDVLRTVEGLNKEKIENIKQYNDFKTIETQIDFAVKHDIHIRFYTDDTYAYRLLECANHPLFYFCKGDTDLNAKRVISIVGTRANSEYGQWMTEKLVADLKSYSPVIISGMAYGIDTICHKASVKNNLLTVGVLAHGLDSIYPPENRILAKQMLESGGALLTEYFTSSKPERFNFPNRNRIVAGISDATIVIETNEKGGSMITAELAYSYKRGLLAVPGRVNDSKSSGCLKLIAANKAKVITGAADIANLLKWKRNGQSGTEEAVQSSLFMELDNDETLIYNLLKNHEQLQIDALYHLCPITKPEIANALLTMEIKNMIKRMPGMIYKLNN